MTPFVDRGKVMKLTQRTTALGIVGLSALGWTALTVAASMTTPKSSEALAGNLPTPGECSQLSPEELAGVGYFRQESCSTCHNLTDGSPKPGPNLANVGRRKDATWMIGHFKNPSEVIPGTSMPPIQLSDAQLNTLAAFLLKLTPENADALAAAPAFAVRGAQIYQDRNCGTCHMVNGVGVKFGPPLNGVAKRRAKEWVEKHFADPKALSPGSAMPAFKFSAPKWRRSFRTYFRCQANNRLILAKDKAALVERRQNMSEPTQIPPRCEFEMGKLVLKLDEVVSSDVSLIDGVVAKITGLIEQRGCAGEDLDNIDLALREALANAILHGNRASPTMAVRVCVALQDDCGMLIVVKDAGSGFEPSQLPNPVVGQNLFAGHGRGIFLINQLMDEVRFDFQQGTAIYMRRTAASKPREPK